MELKTWLKAESLRAVKLAAFLTAVVQKNDAGRVISGSFVSNWASDPATKAWRPIPADLAQSIERFTKREVMRWDCRPHDWNLYWPELRKRRNAPEIIRVNRKAA